MADFYEKLILDGAQEIFDVMDKRVSPAQLEQIKYAFALANKAHAGQWRKSGEPYIIHPIAVARIVAVEMQLDAECVIAAFLHDVVEDTEYTIEDIEREFGPNVAFLVKTVTKKKTDHYEMSKQLDNYKQMLSSLNYDVRAILVKIADRMHNMRTLESMRPDKQMKIAGETDYFYAPLAHRLGFYWIKTELENLSFRFRCPHEYAEMEKMLTADREQNREYLESFVNKIKAIMKRNGVEARVEPRYRMPYSIWRKMKKQQKDFKHVNHRHYVKIIFPYVNGIGLKEKDVCLQIYSYLTDCFKEKPGSVVNLIDNPKENGYQSFHVKLLSDSGRWEEVHICSERMVQDSKLGCISQRTEDNIQKWINKFKGVLQDIATHGMLDGYIEDVVKSFYNDDIMVYTPNGDSIVLPKGATVLDFAFEIHSELGLHAKVARINDKLCSVKTELNRGDCVSIITDDEVWPQSDWIDHVITYKAKRQISSHLSHCYKSIYCRCPQCNPLPGEEVIGFKDKNGVVSIHKRNCSTLIRLASQYGDNIVRVVFHGEPFIHYPMSIHIKAIDRSHLLRDLTECISDRLKLFINSLDIRTEDNIVDCTINFMVHAYNELSLIIGSLNGIDGVEEVTRADNCEQQAE